MRVSINLISTNKYVAFLDDIVSSIDQFFFKDCEVVVIVHTNMNLPESLSKYERIKFVKNEIKHEPWPAPTLKRFHYFLSASSIIETTDYSFYIDVDSLFIKNVESNILPDKGMIGTIHPCLFNGPGTPERNPDSMAGIPYGSKNRYFCGGFFGGDSDSFVRFSKDLMVMIDTDLAKNIMAIWHDESHLNKMFYENPPSVTLEHPFAIGEGTGIVTENTCVLFLDKNRRGGHEFFRN
jgi:hypothetical protein